MSLLLTLLSVLALWALLLLLVIGLMLILKALQAVRHHLQKIAMGVRAIEHQTAALAEHPARLARSLEDAAGAAAGAGARLTETHRHLEAAAPALRGRR